MSSNRYACKTVCVLCASSSVYLSACVCVYVSLITQMLERDKDVNDWHPNNVQVSANVWVIPALHGSDFRNITKKSFFCNIVYLLLFIYLCCCAEELYFTLHQYYRWIT